MRWLKTLVAKTDKLSLVPRFHTVEGMFQLLLDFLLILQMHIMIHVHYDMHMYMHMTHMHYSMHMHTRHHDTCAL